jgi:hypothetical protein
MGIHAIVAFPLAPNRRVFCWSKIKYRARILPHIAPLEPEDAKDVGSGPPNLQFNQDIPISYYRENGMPIACYIDIKQETRIKASAIDDKKSELGRLEPANWSEQLSA